MGEPTKIKLSTVFAVIGAVGSLLAIGGGLLHYGERLGRIELTLDNQTRAIDGLRESIEGNEDDCRAGREKLSKAVMDSYNANQMAISTIREGVAALAMEVRVRDGAATYPPPMPGSPRQPQRVQEKAAADAVDKVLKRRLFPAKRNDPLAGLTF